tara:strand:+ start:1839 stop:2039 length:201 start_codon:yes stop_codon:yes gene_type:complete
MKFQKTTQELNDYIAALESEKIVRTKSNNVNKILSEADEALKRYNMKLKKEGEKYAKQKQSKRKQT